MVALAALGDDDALTTLSRTPTGWPAPACPRRRACSMPWPRGPGRGSRVSGRRWPTLSSRCGVSSGRSAAAGLNARGVRGCPPLPAHAGDRAEEAQGLLTERLDRPSLGAGESRSCWRRWADQYQLGAEDDGSAGREAGRGLRPTASRSWRPPASTCTVRRRWSTPTARRPSSMPAAAPAGWPSSSAGGAIDVVGVDVDEAMLEAARAKAPDLTLGRGRPGRPRARLRAGPSTSSSWPATC